MDVESELPENFDDLSDSEKIDELESLKDGMDEDSDPDIIKKRMIEELIRRYS